MTRRNLQTTISILVFGFLPTIAAGQTTTFNIADGDVAGLITAIQAANAGGGSNVINLAPNGLYILTAVVDNSPDANSSRAAGLPYVRSQLTINGNGATIQRSNASGTPDFVILEVSAEQPDGQNECPGPRCNPNAILTLNGVTITGGSVGALHLTYGTALVQSSTITQNGGGGITNTCGSLTLLNSTVSYNSWNSAFGGGGVFLWDFNCSPTANISFTTIFENSNPGWGRGNAIATNNAIQGNIVVKNSILASPSHTNEGVCNGNPALVTSLGHNIAGDASCVLNGPGDLSSTDPLLGPTTNNGGPTPTDLPLSGSPLIDLVPLESCSDVSGVSVTVDQRGIPRPQGSACDAGSVEVGPKYRLCALYDATKPVHSGATDPIKLRLCDASGNDLSSSTIILHATGLTQVSTSTTGPVQSPGDANPDNDFRFDSTLGTTGGYIFNLSTKGLSTGTYNLNFKITGDTLTYSASFQVTN